MHFNKTITLIKKNILRPLPGIKAHNEMLPLNRPIDISITNSTHRESGVTVLLYPKFNSIYSVLIERPVYEGVHSGQIAFPGGKKENFDLNLIETALRETEEEVGIKKESITVLGCLSTLYIPPSNYMVLPVVGYLKSLPNFILEKKEVNAIIEYDLDILHNQSLTKTKTFKGANYMVEAPYFDINGYSIWGATAMILNEFKKLF